jgi:predicted dienelactone hydrolase
MKRIFLTLALIAAAGCSSAPQKSTPAPQPASYAPSYAFDMGTSPIGVIPSAMLRDATRNKDVEVSIEYPTRGTGPFPIIIFSPGYGGSSHAYEALISYWTSYGYVCIRPMHADSGALRDTMNDLLQMHPEDKRPGRRERTQPRNPDVEARTRPNVAEMIWDKEREPQWRDRVRDVTLVIDSLNDLEKNYPELAGKMDHTRIGVGGHSYGAFTAMLAGGAKTFSNPPLALGDPRVKAIVAMSPQGVAANRGLTAESWRDVKVPAMFMTGSRDYASETEGPDWRRTAYENSPAGDKYFVLIKGASHMTFTGVASGLGEQQQYDRSRDVPITDPRTGQVLNGVPQDNRVNQQINDRGTFRNIRSISLMFWDAYLKDKSDAKALLDPSKYAGSVEFARK